MMDWLPSGDIVHWVVDAVELMDLSAFEAEHRVGGAGHGRRRPGAVRPEGPVGVANLRLQPGRALRKIERLCERDAGYRFIIGEQVPDHTVIARFRRRHSARMAEVFRHVLLYDPSATRRGCWAMSANLSRSSTRKIFRGALPEPAPQVHQ
ncbi:transposase [Rhodovibrio sodomensis]|nr:transposase [Rhodovibrio sodomensis]